MNETINQVVLLTQVYWTGQKRRYGICWVQVAVSSPHTPSWRRAGFVDMGVACMTVFNVLECPAQPPLTA